MGTPVAPRGQPDALPGPRATQGGGIHTAQANVEALAAGPDCPRCGRELVSSKMYPEGTSEDGTTHRAKTCRVEGLWFARAADVSWSIPLSPVGRQ